MQRFWTLIWASVSSISIFPTLGWKNLYNICCWKILGGIIILIGHTCINSIGILDETCGSNTCLARLLTCPTRFKPIDVINLIGWFDQIDVGTTIVPIEIILLMWQTLNPLFHQIFHNGNHNKLILLNAWLVLQVS